MEKDFDKGQESVYSHKVRAGRRRTYFFDVRKTKGDDFYITLTESTRRFNGEGYSRHKIFLYKEDFNRFVKGLEDAVSHVKNELMPEYDYEQFDRRQEEWENAKIEAAKLESAQIESSAEETPDETSSDVEPEEISLDSGSEAEAKDTPDDTLESDEDMDW